MNAVMIYSPIVDLPSSKFGSNYTQEGELVDPVATAAGRAPRSGFRKGSAFWLSFIAILVCTFCSALDLTAIATALPTITESLHGGDEFVPVDSTAILPLSGRFSDAFGRRPVMLAAVGLFFVGSAICGAAQDMGMLIAGRTVQGIGSGAILDLSEIIVSDLVPLAERGTSRHRCFRLCLGPRLWSRAPDCEMGGALSSKANTWRWIFYLNLPLTGIAFLLVPSFHRVRTPPGTIRSKLGRLDIFGNAIIISGTTVALIGLTWAGVAYKWTDVHTLATLMVGFVLIGVFFVYEWLVPKEPSIPWEVVSNRTSLSAYIGTFFHDTVASALFYYLPVYFQACLGSSPLRSSVQILPTMLTISPFAWASVLAWSLMLIGFGLFSTLGARSSTGQWVGYQPVVAAAGIGLLFTGTVFPTLAPLPVSRTAAARSRSSPSRAHVRADVGASPSAPRSSILQNRLVGTRSPRGSRRSSPARAGVQIAYAAIPVIVIKTLLQEPLRREVQDAFAESLKVVWPQTTIGLCGVGLQSVGMMREVPMQKMTDERYGLDENQNANARGGEARRGSEKLQGGAEV
ncbi:major facilitator superfamily domain-containing protein [Ganoderma leucocontextum]|nr:major facilitator superfamily domain-containing protein [Ganoderma leucocontextum]